MKILQVGPYPPPHGGVSVHVYEAQRQLLRAGIACRVLNVDPRAPVSDQYVAIRGACDLFGALTNFAAKGWILHVHANGHNHKSWLVALTAGLAARFGPGCVLTLHSGMTPAYLAYGQDGPRLLARTVCALYQRIIAVSPEIQRVVLSLGCSPDSVNLLPAFLETETQDLDLREIRSVEGRRPRLVSTLFFRPEYGFQLLVKAIEILRRKYPDVVCLVMGTGEREGQARELVSERHLDSNIILLGNVDHERCLAIMSQSDLLLRTALADGDANCVREALSLGVPVVASDVGNRPAGTVLFRTGDVDDLVSKIEQTLAAPRVPAASPSGGHVTSLVDVYKALIKPKSKMTAMYSHRKAA